MSDITSSKPTRSSKSISYEIKLDGFLSCLFVLWCEHICPRGNWFYAVIHQLSDVICQSVSIWTVSNTNGQKKALQHFYSLRLQNKIAEGTELYFGIQLRKVFAFMQELVWPAERPLVINAVCACVYSCALNSSPTICNIARDHRVRRMELGRFHSLKLSWRM